MNGVAPIVAWFIMEIHMKMDDVHVHFYFWKPRALLLVLHWKKCCLVATARAVMPVMPIVNKVCWKISTQLTPFKILTSQFSTQQLNVVLSLFASPYIQRRSYQVMNVRTWRFFSERVTHVAGSRGVSGVKSTWSCWESLFREDAARKDIWTWLIYVNWSPLYIVYPHFNWDCIPDIWFDPHFILITEWPNVFVQSQF